MRKELKVFFETTNYCNYKCIYCFANTCRRIQDGIVLDFEKYKTIIDSLSTLDYDLSVLLEGGEPLTVNNICEYGKYAKSFAKKVALGSNVSLIPHLSEDMLKNIKETFEEVSVGFDTTKPELFAKLVNYPIDDALNGIDILIKNNIPVKICTVVTKYNTDFYDVVRFCEKKNIKKLRFYWFIPRETNDHSLLPGDNDYLKMEHDLKHYNGDLNIKLNKTYQPYMNIVVSSKGEIRIATDNERKNMQLIGKYDNFIDKLKELLK